MRLLDALPVSARATLEQTCTVLGIPLHSWEGEPGLRIYKAVAIEAQAARLQQERGCSWEWAAREACETLGLSFEAHRRRLERMRARARGQIVGSRSVGRAVGSRP